MLVPASGRVLLGGMLVACASETPLTDVPNPSAPTDEAPIPTSQSRPIGINLGVPEFMGDAFFVDAVRNTAGFRDLDTWAFVPTDADGWPLAASPDEPAVLPLFGEATARWFPAGAYVLRYAGTGTVEIWADDATVGPAESLPDGVTRIEVQLDPGALPPETDVLLAITDSSPADPVRDVHFVLPGFEETFESEPFNPNVLDKWRRYGMIRPLHPQAFWDFPDTELVPDVDWDDRMRPDDFRHGRRWSYEAMIDLANALDADLWLGVPHTATLAYTTALAELVRDRLDAEQTAYVEFANECWNGFSNTHEYAAGRGEAMALFAPDAPGDAYQAAVRWCAVQTVEHTNRFRDVFGETGDEDRVVRVFGGFIANPWLYRHEEDGQPEGALFEDRTSTGRPAWQDVDAVAVATYFGGELALEEVSDVTRTWTLDEVFAYFETGALPAGTPPAVEAELDGGVPGTVRFVEEWAATIEDLELELLAYEGGPHLVSVASPEVDDLFVQALRDPRMEDLVVDLLDGAAAAGLTRHVLFVSAEPLVEELPWPRFGFVEHGLAPTDEAWRWRAVDRWLDEQAP